VRFLFEHENIDFDHARDAIAKFFRPGHVVVIHDGDGSTLLDCLRGSYCAGTVTSPRGALIASFAIDYLARDAEEEPSHREVVAIHIGPPGYWCRNIADLDRYNSWVADLAEQYEAEPNAITRYPA
jgi:hypothetical protein